MIAVAAMAMIAFAGCKKESNTITLGVGMEQPQGSDKEAWYNAGNQVAFEVNDAALINGRVYELTLDPAGNVAGNSTYSLLAKVELNGAELSRPAYMYYPANDFQYNETYTAPDMAQHVMSLLNPYGSMYMPLCSNDFGAITTAGNEWPLVAYLPRVEQSCVFKLKNTTALFAPAVKVGQNFIDSYNAKFSTNISYDNFRVRLNSMTVYCPEHPLFGVGYIENPESAYNDDAACKFRIDPALGNDYNNTLVAYTGRNNGVGIVRNDAHQAMDIIQYVGYCPVPEYTDGTLNVVMNFTIMDDDTEVATYNYTANPITINSNTLLRNQRCTLVLDCYSPRAANSDWWGHWTAM